MKVLEEEIDLVQAHGDYRNLVLIGDFNFPTLIWEDKLVRIVQDMTSQQEIFASFLGKFCLYNCVEVPTRWENVLDLILTNNEHFAQPFFC